MLLLIAAVFALCTLDDDTSNGIKEADDISSGILESRASLLNDDEPIRIDINSPVHIDLDSPVHIDLDSPIRVEIA